MIGQRLAPMPDINWRRTSEYSTRCPGCGVRCHAEKGNHHERTDCTHYLGAMSAAQACLITPGRGEEIVAQGTVNKPESIDRWHVFRIRDRRYR